MTKIFTENDVIRLIYGELDHQKSTNIQLAAAESDELQDSISSLHRTKSMIDAFELKMPARLSEKILKRVADMHKASV
ncbi:MAG: hypothetical protein ACI8QD_002328 [Cyclobacteriaceae bacterium]|jgi:hypothetical protein